MTASYISETEIIRHFPEYILKTEANQRVVITKNNNPIAALVNIRDFRRIEQKEQKEEGLASVMGQWDNFDELGEILADISSIREKGGFGRDVSF
ncbi:MAG: type II toxin-antitoxin system Phd/YefM family antitoxin [Deltaproteobacteria bacterium]|nr:MAG: type II toxin-antitoxin system Phd/YefM family antitoxin [Deltaproteobacteria bacterium]